MGHEKKYKLLKNDYKDINKQNDIVEIEKGRKVSIRKSCYICDNLYNNEKCPLCSVYCSANYYGDSTFDEVAKYKVSCTEFLISKKLEE